MRGKLKWATFVPGFYWSSTTALRAVLWLVGRWTVTGRENVPADGALIIVSNHLNNADPPILSAGIARRRVRYMAKIELFKYPLGAIVRLFGAFPVRRFESDVGALLTAERILKNGGVLGMFPEGTRSRTGYVGKPHPGTAMIALRSGATVLPCAIVGTEQLGNPLNVLKKPRIAVLIGEPIRLDAVRRPTETQVSELTDRLFGAITGLLPPQYLPSYTEPEGTSRNTDGAGNPGQ